MKTEVIKKGNNVNKALYYVETRGWIFSFSWTMMVPIINAEETIDAQVTLVET